MAKLLLRQIRAAMWPAILVIWLLARCHFWLRWWYPDAANQRALQVNAFIGWIGIMFLAATLAGVIAAASQPPSARPTGAPHDGPDRLGRGRLFLTYAMMLDSCGLLLLGVGMGGGFITLPDVLRIYLLVAAWVGMWMQFAALLRRFGPRSAAPAAAVTLSLAALLFAAPVTLLPLARAATGRMQENIVSAIGWATPLLGCFGAMKHSLLIGWAQQPEMYRLSSLGQDIPMALPAWWQNAVLYAAVAALAWAARLIRPRSPAHELAGQDAAFSSKK